jgi:uncharacterized membrane protein YeaQ/YmgE (transglycosylase-associated protein family)
MEEAFAFDSTNRPAGIGATRAHPWSAAARRAADRAQGVRGPVSPTPRGSAIPIVRRRRSDCFNSPWAGIKGAVQILGLIIIGAIIGIIARLVTPGRQRIGVLMTVLLGIGGAIVGGVVASAIGTGSIFELNVIGTIVGIIAAVGLIALAQTLGVGGGRARRV